MTLSRAVVLENAGIVERLIHLDLFQDNLGPILAVRTGQSWLLSPREETLATMNVIMKKQSTREGFERERQGKLTACLIGR